MSTTVPPQPDSPLITHKSLNNSPTTKHLQSNANDFHSLTESSAGTMMDAAAIANERGIEPPPPTTRFINCGCVTSTFKFGIPFLVTIFIGSISNSACQQLQHDSGDMVGAFLQSWIPVAFVICYLRWKYFRVVLTVELLSFFLLSSLCILPYAYALVYISDNIADRWQLYSLSMSEWLNVDRFLLMCVHSFVFIAAIVEMYKILFLYALYERRMIACPTALIIYSCVISAGVSCCIQALFINNTQSIWLGMIITILSLPLNIATGIYEAMYFSTLRFAAHESDDKSRFMSIDSIDVTITFNTKKNQLSSQFTYSSHKPNLQAQNSQKPNPKNQNGTPNRDREVDLQAGINDKYHLLSSDNRHSVSDGGGGNGGGSGSGSADFDDLNVLLHSSNNGVMNSMYQSVDIRDTRKYSRHYLQGNIYITNFDRYRRQRSSSRVSSRAAAAPNAFKPWRMFLVCWLSHSLQQLLMSFISGLFRECYPAQTLFFPISHDRQPSDYGVILCGKHSHAWLALLWVLVAVAVMLELWLIGYVRHLWLIYFKDGAKVNVHYLLMRKEIPLPLCIRLFWCCCQHCFFCEIHSSTFSEYGMLLSPVRGTRLSTSEQRQYQRMKHQLENME